MCTAITYSGNDFYFGRTLDLERSYGEDVVITPRRFPLSFTGSPPLADHPAIIGIAHVAGVFPLYYDAVNEAGLCMAGLNFPESAQYASGQTDTDGVACFEFIPWVLSRCRSIQQVRDLLPGIRLTDTPFSPELPCARLHWLIADASGALTIEATAAGLAIYDNPVGVLTNEPPFPEQMRNLCDYMQLSPEPAVNRFFPPLELTPYSRGMGAMGLPGDLSSRSRFVRAAFSKLNAISPEGEDLAQFFHILDTVSQPMGNCRLADGSCVITQYASCCNASRGIYYYRTYTNQRLCAVELQRENLNGASLRRFPLCARQDICLLNG